MRKVAPPVIGKVFHRLKHFYLFHKERSRYRRKIRKIKTIQHRRSVKRNYIFLIVIDAFRQDFSSLDSKGLVQTPFLKELSLNSLYFPRAIVASPWTYPSVASLLTGLYPYNHGGVLQKEYRHFSELELPLPVKKDKFMLSEIFACSGFKTYFISDIGTAFVCIKGRFEHLHFLGKEENCILSNFYRIFKKEKPKRAFFYLQLGDLHEPIFASDNGRFKELIENSMRYIKEEKDKKEVCKYLNMLVKMDNYLSQFFEFLKKENIIDKSTIVITSDHGEEFWEHEEMAKKIYSLPVKYGYGHGHTLFQEVIEVPIFIIDPEINARKVEKVVSQVDIFPTISEIARIPEVPYPLDGISLCSENIKNRVIISEEVGYGYEKKCAISFPYKIIRSIGDGIDLCFNLEKDPYEKEPLPKTDIFENLLFHLPPFEYKTGKSISINKETAERLKGLGYF